MNLFASCLTRQSSLRFANSLQESTSVRQFLVCRLVSVVKNTWEQQKKSERRWALGICCARITFLIHCCNECKSQRDFFHDRNSVRGQKHTQCSRCCVSFGFGSIYLWSCVSVCVFLCLHVCVDLASPLWEPWAGPGSRCTRWWRAPRWLRVFWSREGQRRHSPGRTGPAGTLTDSSPAHRSTKAHNDTMKTNKQTKKNLLRHKLGNFCLP